MHDADHPTYRPAGHVLAIVVIALVVAAVLNAGPMLRRAEQKPFDDPLRDETTAAWSVVQRSAALLSLDRPRAAIDALTGRAPDDAASLDELLAETPGPGEATARPRPPQVSVPPSSTTPPDEVELRVPTSDEPLRVYAGGDSLATFPARELQRVGQVTGLLAVEPEPIPNSGLVRHDYFNWPQHLVENVLPDDPEVVVLLFGGNDSQGIRLDDGTVCDRFTDCWIDEYERRVEGTMDLLRDPDGDRLVIWLGIPITGPEGLSNPDIFNGIAATAAADRPWVTYLDTWNLFVDDDGGYAARLPDASGEPRVVRGADQIHLTSTGGSWMAWETFAELGAHVDLSNWRGSAPAGERAPDRERRDDPPRPPGSTG